MKRFFQSLYIDKRLIIALAVLIFLFILGFPYFIFLVIAKIAFVLLCLAVIVDFFLLYLQKKGIWASRDLTDRMSNGDENPVYINVENYYQFPVSLEVIDEIPHQFQRRDILFQLNLASQKRGQLTYKLRPTERGVYDFGRLLVYVKSPLSLIKKRYAYDLSKEVAVYPSYLQLRKYELMAISNRLQDIGIKKIRKIGHNLEFDQIRDYVIGDDFRNVNWKATARRGQFMVNQYQDEKSQPIYNVIDKGRAMKMPFDGMTLLDYAINTSLILSNVALTKDDQAGLLTFSNTIDSVVPAGRKKNQMFQILEMLYRQKTEYKESDFGVLYQGVKHSFKRRGLMMLYTNFESLVSLNRQVEYLRRIAKHHLLVVVFFENKELLDFKDEEAQNTEEIYEKTIAEKYVLEKRQIVKELQSYGIHSVLTSPENLTVAGINKYLELKARGLI
ncbi:MAG: DUF58 domain-containing protein [Cytophagales bacterium]|nr:DUF58 domain-containing protein [Cytophagales bacterium]